MVERTGRGFTSWEQALMELAEGASDNGMDWDLGAVPRKEAVEGEIKRLIAELAAAREVMGNISYWQQMQNRATAAENWWAEASPLLADISRRHVLPEDIMTAVRKLMEWEPAQ